MTRRLICLVLVICLCVVFSVPAFAAEERIVGEVVITEAQIQAEIEAKKAETMALVYEQLQLQGKTHMLADYEEVLFPEIEATIYAKYGVENENAVQAVPQYRFTYGGTMANTTVAGRSAVSTYMDFKNSYYYILTGGTSTKAKVIIEAILGSLPAFGPVFTALFAISTLLPDSTKLEIADAGGYARILTLSSSTDYSSVLMAWDTYPYASPYAYDETKTLEWAVFPEHDPFE